MCVPVLCYLNLLTDQSASLPVISWDRVAGFVVRIKESLISSSGKHSLCDVKSAGSDTLRKLNLMLFCFFILDLCSIELSAGFTLSKDLLTWFSTLRCAFCLQAGLTWTGPVRSPECP